MVSRRWCCAPGAEQGPTEFRPKSHEYTRDLKKMYMQAFVHKRLVPPVRPTLAKGAALLVGGGIVVRCRSVNGDSNGAAADDDDAAAADDDDDDNDDDDDDD